MSKAAKLVFALVVISSMLLAACGATPTATPAPTQTPVVKVVTQVVQQTVVVPATPVVQQVVVTATPVPPTPVPTKPAEKASDTVVLALQQEPDTLHPGIGSMMAKTVVLNYQIFTGCVGQDDKVKWVPFGCETVPTLENGGAKFVGDGADKHLEVTFKIKKGWRWTDGTPVTAKDAVYQWKLYMDPDFEIASRTFYEKIFDVVAVDDSTILYKFMSNAQAKAAEAGTLKGNVPFEKYVDDYVANGYSASGGPVVDPIYYNAAGWLPSHILSKVAAKDQAASDFAKKPVGDGPYVVSAWKAGQEVDLTLSDKAYPLGTPKIKNIVYRIIGDTKAIIASLQKGEIDAATTVAGLSPADSPDLDKIAAGGNYKVVYMPQYSWEHIDLNVQKFPLNDVKVRQALYTGIDKKTIIDTLYFGKYYPAELPGAVLQNNSWAYTTDYTKYTFDTKAAIALLTSAGWDCKALPCTKTVDGAKKEFSITLMTTDRADRQKLAQVIQSMWKAINVGTNLQFLYGRGLFATCSAGGPLYCRTYDAAIYTWVGGDDPSFLGLYDCAGIPTKENGYVGQNNPGWCNKEADAALQSSENTADIAVSQEKRKPFIFTFFKAWTAEVPVIPLFVNSVPVVFRTGFKNYSCGPTQYSDCAWNVQLWELSK